MNAVTEKLKSKSGISLAIALVFFLLCVMVGVVVLSAASVSAGNTARERQLYRETLALTSAAELLSEDIQKMTFTGVKIKKEIVKTTVEPGQEGQDDPTTKVETNEEMAFGAPKLEHSQFFKVKETMGAAGITYSDNLHLTERYFENQNGSNAESVKQTIVFNAVESRNIPKVTGTVEVGADYTLTVVLSCGNSSLTMSFPPNSVEKTAVSPPVTNQDENTSSRTTQTTYTTTLTWKKPLIKEGGAPNA